MDIEWIPALVAATWAIVLGGAGGALTEIGPWYRNLKKPSWQPPDWLFGPAWTIILGLAGWSLYLGWTAAMDRIEWLLIIAMFTFNFVAHLAWSPLFFKMKRPDIALIEIVFLWLSIAAMIAVLWPVSEFAAWLNVPYLAWVSFAAFLNWKIVKLNGPFEGASAQQ